MFVWEFNGNQSLYNRVCYASVLSSSAQLKMAKLKQASGMGKHETGTSTKREENCNQRQGWKNIQLVLVLRSEKSASATVKVS